MLKKYTIALVGAAAVLGLGAQASGDVLGNLLSGPTSGASSWNTTHASVTGGSGYTIGSGLNFPAATVYTVRGFPTGGSEAASITGGDVVTWGLNFNQPWNLDQFLIRYGRGSTGPDDLSIQISINGGAFTTVHSDTAVSTTGEEHLAVSLAAFDNVTSVLFRYVGWAATNSTGTFRFENSANIGNNSFRLTASAVPEPAAAGLLGLLALGLLRRRHA